MTYWWAGGVWRNFEGENFLFNLFPSLEATHIIGLFVCIFVHTHTHTHTYTDCISLPRLVQVRRLKSSCWQGRLLQKAMREGMFHALFLTSDVLLAIFDVPWLIDVTPQSLPLCLHGVLILCVSVSTFPLFIGIPAIFN